MGGLSIWHWIVVAVVVMLLFGRGKISEMMGDAAKGIKAFKKGMQDDDVAANDPKNNEAVRKAEPMRTIEQEPVVRRTDNQNVG